MITFLGRSFLVLGLGKTGQAAMRALKRAGAHVLAWDDAGEKPEHIPWTTLQAVVVSPGIPSSWPYPHPLIERARQQGLPLLSDVDVLRLLIPRAFFLAITGTNGKSTTTAWLEHVLKKEETAPCVMGGNIGLPALDLPLLPEGRYVLELSSYQLELSLFPLYAISILLNITPDHLTRHGGWEGYVTAKRRIFLNPQAIAIVGVDDLHGQALVKELRKDPKRSLIPVSGNTVPPQGIGWADGVLIDAHFSSLSQPILEQEEILQGAHNRQNAAAVCAAALACGVPLAALISGLRSFSGLVHRQEEVLSYEYVTFINDSKATNAASVIPAFERFRSLYWIAGGRPKEDGLTPLIPYGSCIKKAFLIGEAAQDFAQVLTRTSISYEIVHTLDKAVPAAFLAAQREATPESPQTVLFSPACASFDQFRDFEERGNYFKRLVYSLCGESSKEGEEAVSTIK
jgi:UDP-N-acetylmuramoylalanine--D-glutamate ligase